VRLFRNFEALVGCAVCTVSMPRRKVGYPYRGEVLQYLTVGWDSYIRYGEL